MQQSFTFQRLLVTKGGQKTKLQKWYHRLLECVERGRQRRQLLRLDDRLLNDIGITREQALIEANKPCWEK